MGVGAQGKAIHWFEDISLADVAQVGGKGASLGELARAGLPVPEGFVIGTAAFRRFLDQLDPEGGQRAALAALDPADMKRLNAACSAMRSRLLAARMPDPLCRDIVQALARLGDTPVAVRSSATAEDSAEASFAGLQDTYLWVSGAEDILGRVRACWASLYNPESLSYRLRLKLPEEQLGMAVVVQRMVDARCAGVMFTRSPTSGDRSVVSIEASWGLGSCLVSGEVTPDRLVVSKITGEISQRSVGRKALAHCPREQGGVSCEEVPEEQQTQPCLSDAEIRALAMLAGRVEAHYGCPQDIEWAIPHGSSEIRLLQSRPETVWAARDRAPVARPAARPFDHVFRVLGGRGSSPGRG